MHRGDSVIVVDGPGIPVGTMATVTQMLDGYPRCAYIVTPHDLKEYMVELVHLRVISDVQQR